MQKPETQTEADGEQSSSSGSPVHVCVGVLLEQRVHVQQVVLDGRTGDRPAGASPQPTHGHGRLHFGVFYVVGFVEDHAGPGHSQQRSRRRRLRETYTRRVYISD